MARNSGTTTLAVGGSSILNVPGFANLDVTISGTLTNNGTFLLSGFAGSPSFPAGFSFATLNSANATFARNSGGTVTLQLGGSVSGGALNGSSADDLRLISTAATVNVSTAGVLTFAGSFQVRPISVGNFFLEGNWITNNGWITANLVNGSLQLSGARLRSTVVGLFAVNIPLPAIDVPFDGNFSIPVIPPDMTVWNFPFTGINFNLKRYAPNLFGIRQITLENFAGNFNRAGFGQRFTGGYMFSDGGNGLFWSGALSLGGFASSAGSGYLTLTDGTMSAGGSFNLFAAGRTFNSGVQFDGTVDKNGQYLLTGSASLDIANIEMPSASLTFQNGKISGSPTLKFGDGSGKIDFTPSNFQLNSTFGVSFSHSVGFNQSVSIANSVSIASINLTANLSVSGGNSGQVQVTGSASAFGINLPNLNFGIGSDLEFVLNFGLDCTRFDLAPVRAKVCGTSAPGWP